MSGPTHPFGSLLPLALLRRLHGRDGARPAVVTLSGTVLIVDVSRYTSLVEGLSRQGQVGLEQIPALLNRAYTGCVETIAATGGEVIRFTGDAVSVFWPDAPGGPQQAAMRAQHCARAICGDTAAVAEGSAGQHPGFHAGIGHGALWVAAIGGSPNWNLVTGGMAAERAARALTRAGPGTVSLSRATRDLIARHAEDNAPAPRFAPIECEAPPRSEWLRGFLPPNAQRLLGSASAPIDLARGLGSAAEIRPMSVLFARLSGLSTRTPTAAPRLHQLCRQIQSALQARDGPAGEFFVEADGMVCLAAFGETGASHSDDPRRALDTAHAIAACARDAGLQTAIGVATGESLYQLVGSPDHLGLMLLGQPVNRAARLMARASGDVLCDTQTRRRSGSQFTFADSGALQLTGLGEIVPVFQPLQAQAAPADPSEIIGRNGELAALDTAYREVSAGAKRLVAVIGEPGIGKTTLVTAFAAGLAASGKSITIARAERDNRRTSLLVWRQVLHALAGLPHDSDGRAVFDAIRVRLGEHPDLTARLALLGDVLGVELSDTDGTAHLSGAHRADAAMRLIVGIIGALAPRPFAIVLEDSQWLDSASWRLVEWALASLDRLLVVACVRVGEIPDQLRALQDRADRIDPDQAGDDADIARMVRVIRLMELDAPSLRQLITRTLDGVPAREEIEQRIMALAGGNPLFLEEIALSLKSEGLISQRDGRWQSIRAIDDLVYFEGVEKVIRERMDQLAFKTRDVLITASVIGRSFDMLSLGALLEGDVKPQIGRLVDAQLVVPKAQDGWYEFRHDQIRDVAYHSIPSDRRQALHLALAQWLEPRRADAAIGEIATLVQHFEAAGAHDHAVRYADIAATDALRIGAYREVESFLAICLEHEPPRSRRTQDERFRAVRWRRQLAEAHYGRGDIRAQGIAIRDALDAAGETLPANAVSTGLRLAARGLRILVRPARRFSQELPADTDAARWDVEIARCLNQAATVDYFQLRFTRGMCNLLGAVNRSEKSGISTETVMSNCQLGAGLGMMGLRRLSARMMNRAEDVAQRLRDPSLQSHVCTLDALWRLGFCEWEAVDARLDAAQRLALSSGDQLRWCNAQGIRFWSQYYRGDLGALEETTRQLLLRAQNAGNIQQEIWALRCKGLCLLHIERPREAVEVLRLTKAGMSGSEDLAAQISAMGALALGLTRIGRHTEGYDAAVKTLRLLDRMRRPSSHSVVVGISSVLEVLLRGREAGVSDTHEEWGFHEIRALRMLDRYSKVFAVGRAQLGMWRGKCHWLDGRHDHAMSDWRKAREWANRHQLRKDAALVDAEMRRWQMD